MSWDILWVFATSTHCNTLQHTVTHCNHCNKLQQTAMSWDILWVFATATHCNTWQHTATHCNTLQHTATHRNTLQHTVTHMQHAATHCNTTQRSTAHWLTSISRRLARKASLSLACNMYVRRYIHICVWTCGYTTHLKLTTGIIYGWNIMCYGVCLCVCVCNVLWGGYD